jgi:hypothetical protein
MQIQIACPKCSEALRVPSEFNGKKVSCKKCGKTFRVKIKSTDKVLNSSEVLCRFCGEEVKPAAIKCKHCGSHLRGDPAVGYFFAFVVFVVLFWSFWSFDSYAEGLREEAEALGRHSEELMK